MKDSKERRENMARDIFTNAKRSSVYYPLGTFQDDPQRKKYVKAPFDIVQLHANNDVQSYQYFMPTQMGEDISGAYNNDAVAEEQYQGRTGMIWETLNNRVIGEHQMGDWENETNTFYGFHCIGII
jgi:hypothetical protein